MERVSEMTTEPIVGKLYLVECVRLSVDGWQPVIGTPHADPELGADWMHQHKDIRFVSKAAMYEKDAVRELLRAPDMDYLVERAVRKMKCKRTMPEYPHEYLEANISRYRKVWRGFHESYIGRKVLCGKCPHKGMPLESLPKDKDGMVICNGHGLRISMKDQVVVRR